MKYQSFNNKKKYNKNKTFKYRFAYQKGGTENSLVSIIDATPNSQTIGPKDNMYPSSYIGYTVFVPPESKPFTLAQLVNDALGEGEFLKADKSIDLTKVNEQFMNDSFRMNLFINNTKVFESFKNKITNTNESNNIFNQQLSQLQPITEPPLFTTKLLEIFPKLNVRENEIKCIQEFANKNNWTILPNYWAFLPFYDQILNELGIRDESKLDNIKLLSQQTISKTMMDILMKFVSLTTVFHDTLQLGGSFKTFGHKMNDYISQVPTAPFIDINITNSNPIIQNKLYFSLVNVPNEFGLAVISTCIYADFQKNEVFMIWKIERWRNNVIKKFYHFIIDMSNKGSPVSEDLLEIMQTYIYNNKISDDYPNTHKGLLEYVIKNASTSKDVINNLNKMVKEQLTKNASDNDIAKLIKSEVLSDEPESDTPEVQKEEELEKEQTRNNIDMPNESQEDNSEDANTIETQLELEKSENGINDEADQQVTNDEEKVNNDEVKMEEAKENVSNAIDQYNRDEQQLRDDQPPPSDTDNLTNTLATLGSVTALGAIGSGLYFAAPLLILGGSKKNKRKYIKKSKRTRRK